MNTFKFASAFAILSASTAMAGGYVEPIVPVPVYEAPKGFSWTGPYVGVSAGHTDIDLRRNLTERTPVTVEHPAVLEDVEVPAKTKLVEHDAVTETREKVIEHPAETELVEHEAETFDHPPVEKEHPEVAIDHEGGKLWVSSDEFDILVGDHEVINKEQFNNGNGEYAVPNFDKGHFNEYGWWSAGENNAGEYDHYAYAEAGRIVIKEGYTEVLEPGYTEVIKEAWTEEVVVKEAWTETVEETVVVKEAYTEEVVVRPAYTKTIVVEEPWTEVVGATFTTSALAVATDTNTYGVFAGYRNQFNNKFVLGAEANYSQAGDVSGTYKGRSYSFDLNTVSVEAQFGYAFDRILPYVGVGYAVTEGDGAWMASAGIDYAVTDNVLLGVKYSHYEYDDLSNWEADADSFAVRVGWKF